MACSERPGQKERVSPQILQQNMDLTDRRREQTPWLKHRRFPCGEIPKEVLDKILRCISCDPELGRGHESPAGRKLGDPIKPH